jgi:hypothetical protein
MRSGWARSGVTNDAELTSPLTRWSRRLATQIPDQVDMDPLGEDDLWRERAAPTAGPRVPPLRAHPSPAVVGAGNVSQRGSSREVKRRCAGSPDEASLHVRPISRLALIRASDDRFGSAAEAIGSPPRLMASPTACGQASGSAAHRYFQLQAAARCFSPRSPGPDHGEKAGSGVHQDRNLPAAVSTLPG